jgi:hypothetical protein
MDTNKTLSQYHMIGGEDSVKMGQTGDPITEWRGIPSRHGREWMWVLRDTVEVWSRVQSLGLFPP